MGVPSSEASNAIIYVSYSVFLFVQKLCREKSKEYDTNPHIRLIGLWIGWVLRKQSKAQFLASNKTQKGQKTIKTRSFLFAKLQEEFALDAAHLTHHLILLQIICSPCWLSPAIPLALNFIASGKSVLKAGETASSDDSERPQHRPTHLVATSSMSLLEALAWLYAINRGINRFVCMKQTRQAWTCLARARQRVESKTCNCRLSGLCGFTTGA